MFSGFTATFLKSSLLVLVVVLAAALTACDRRDDGGPSAPENGTTNTSRSPGNESAEYPSDRLQCDALSEGGERSAAEQAFFAANCEAVAALPDRTSCTDITGTAYRSESERAWYLSNCGVPTQPQPGPVSTPVQAAFGATPAPVNTCPTDITLNVDFAREYFEVTGMTLDEINASLRANAPFTEDGQASGVTEYRLSIASGRCVGTAICKLGTALIGASGRVLLPRHTAEGSLTGTVRQVWSRFAQDVATHEERHVTIVKEGIEEAKRNLLAIPAQPDCTELDRIVGETWRNAVNSIDQRQDAFHVADRFGVGAAVVQ